ncbi:MAG: cobalamin-binding protein [Acidobacteria bacterium]|nr:cobalamin-binding protein [Acidobacteriota bacterium]
MFALVNSKSFVRFIGVLLLGFLAACSTRPLPPQNLRTVTDELGRVVHIVPAPQRLVSLAPSITETLFALGLGEKIVGVTSYCDYPPAAKTKTSIGDTLKPSLEKIIALKPDLVIASTSSQLESFVRNLENAGIAVYVSNPRNLEETLKSIEVMGEITGASESASALTDNLRARIAQVHSRVARLEKPAVFMMLGAEPLITVGGRSFISDLITQAGGRSISADEASDYPQYSLETVIARKPDIIFLQAGDDKLPTRLRQTPAAINGRVYHLSDEVLLRPGPRIVDGLEQLAEKIHPAALRSP